MSKSSDKSYQTLSAELDAIVADMQRDDADIDALMKQYETGLKLIEQLEKRLRDTQTTITEIQKRNAL